MARLFARALRAGLATQAHVDLEADGILARIDDGDFRIDALPGAQKLAAVTKSFDCTALMNIFATSRGLLPFLSLGGQ